MIESGVSEARGELRLFLTGSVHGKNNTRYGHIILQSWRSTVESYLSMKFQKSEVSQLYELNWKL